MSIRAGLVGLPNVGKSTLFNALTKSSVPAENYPFCTIEPHMAFTAVPDQRIERLQKIYNAKKTIPATLQFVDIAGLVKGAAKGEGLGNQFLSHIREVDLILYVLRCFENPDIAATRLEPDPLDDFEIITAELMLKDLESIQKRQEKVEKLIKANRGKPAKLKELQTEQLLLTKLHDTLRQGSLEKVKNILQNIPLTTLPLLCTKDFLLIANIAEDDLGTDIFATNKYVQTLVDHFGKEKVIPISAKIEQELSQLPDQQARQMMNMFGIKEKGLDQIIRQAYKNLRLITFFTCGPKEIHAWPIKKGTNVREASGQIHSDLQRGFIFSEVFNCNDLFQLGGPQKLKEKGLIRTEGQDYIVQDGDIIFVKFSV